MVGSGSPDPVLVARLRAAGCVFAEDEAALLVTAAQSPAELERMVAERVAGQPLEHILGWAEFAGLRIVLAPGVFVPRRRTEFLVRQAVALAPLRPVVVDLCCGSGAVAAAIATELVVAGLYAVDIDPVAIACAARNLDSLGGTALLGDLYEPLPARLRGSVDLLVVNAPYVPTDAIALMPPEARDHEPRVALDGGYDGLDVHRRVAAHATQWLAPGGHLLIETSKAQAPVAADLFAGCGLTPRTVSDDGDEGFGGTVVIGTR
jgi:release factor glutamine methyltransferase